MVFGLVALGALVVGALVWTPLPPGLWHDDGVYLIAEPCDPFLEAVRTGLETGTGIEFIEPSERVREVIAEFLDTLRANRSGV